MENLTSLAERIKQGDRAAFNTLYLLYYTPLKNYGKSFVDATEAEDIIQDVFLKIWLHKENIDKDQSLKAYLFRSVYNSSINALNKKRSSQNWSDYQQMIDDTELQYYDPDSNEVIQALYSNDMRVCVNKAINDLPHKCKEVFILSYIKEESCKDISEKLHLSLSTVHNHIYNALKLLRVKLRNRGKDL